jgi:hypothetical protein
MGILLGHLLYTSGMVGVGMFSIMTYGSGLRGLFSLIHGFSMMLSFNVVDLVIKLCWVR